MQGNVIYQRRRFDSGLKIVILKGGEKSNRNRNFLDIKIDSFKDFDYKGRRKNGQLVIISRQNFEIAQINFVLIFFPSKIVRSIILKLHFCRFLIYLLDQSEWSARLPTIHMPRFFVIDHRYWEASLSESCQVFVILDRFETRLDPENRIE